MPALAAEWPDEEFAPQELTPPPRRRPTAAGELPASVEAAIWRGDQLGRQVTEVLGTGFAALDRELPGGGWPCQSITEILQPQPTVTEWRLLGPAIPAVIAKGQDIVVVGPPKAPHLAGLRRIGIDERRLVWIQAESPAERLWVTEQVIKANAVGMLISWLPQARPEQVRRLQVCAQASDGPVFLCRPVAAQHDASAAPLRVAVEVGLDWELHVRLIKRKGPALDRTLVLPSVPGGLASILTPRLSKPSELIADRQAQDLARQPPAKRAPAPLSIVPDSSKETSKNAARVSTLSAVTANETREIPDVVGSTAAGAPGTTRGDGVER